MFSSKRTESREKQSFTKSGKYGKSMTSSFSKEAGVSKRRYEPRNRRPLPPMAPPPQPAPTSDAVMTSPIITLVVGADHRMFAAHEHILAASPYFAAILRSQADDGMVEGSNRKIYLPDEDPAILSSILEYLYKGDYYPRLVHNKRRNSWELEPLMDDGEGAIDSTIFHSPTEGALLKDTVIYCAAEKFGLEELKRIALRKQGLQSGIQCSTILASARYAYANTPDTDSKLRAHYLALIIRSRSTFKRSGTMQLEMYNGGTQLFFDLFVALCNHVDDISSTAQGTPRTPRSGRNFF